MATIDLQQYYFVAFPSIASATLSSRSRNQSCPFASRLPKLFSDDALNPSTIDFKALARLPEHSRTFNACGA
jgi:hypothetical protein